MDAQMKKGVLEMCVLHLLFKDSLYGYEIMRRIQESFPDVYDGSVYAVLRRLHREGYAVTYKGEVSGGPPRKYYKLTDSGIERLNDALLEWKGLLDSVRDLGIGEV